MRAAALRARLPALPIRPEERARVRLCFLYFFALLSGYSILRPLRDEMSVREGVGKVPWLFSGTLAAMLLLVPVFGFLSSRIPRGRLLAGVQLFFAVNLLAFSFAFARPGKPAWTGPAFFIWVAVFGLFAVSVSWSFMADLYRRDEAVRLFGFVAAGSSAGAIAGPAAMALLAPRLAPARLLLVAAAVLGVCAFAAWRLRAHLPESAERGGEDAMGGRALAGVGRTLRSPLLLAMALTLVCSALISTFLYLAQTEVVGAAMADAGRRTALFAKLDLAVNGATIVLQLFVTGRLVRRLGVGGALALVAGLVTLGVAGLGLAPGLAAVVGLQVVHRAGHFSVGRPAREALFVSLDAEARYKAKSFLDTAVSRASDSAGAWLLVAFRSGGFGLRETAWLVVPVGVVWTAASYWLGRRGEERPACMAAAPETPIERSVA